MRFVEADSSVAGLVVGGFGGSRFIGIGFDSFEFASCQIQAESVRSSQC